MIGKMIIYDKILLINTILFLTLLTGCANVEFEDWRKAKAKLEHGVQLPKNYKAKLQGQYLFVQKLTNVSALYSN